MKVELLVSEWCPTCPAAEKVWREVADERVFDFAVIDVMQPEGREIVARLRVRSVPSVVVDGELKAVGVQTPDEARALVAAAPVRERAPRAYHTGLMLSADNRLWIVSAMAYLIAAGLGLALSGGLLDAGPGTVHLFTGGFVLFLIFGLGAHMLPRFTGRPILGRAWPGVQLVTGQVGLPLLVLGLALPVRWIAIAGAVLLLAAFAVYAIRILLALMPFEPERRPGVIQFTQRTPDTRTGHDAA